MAMMKMNNEIMDKIDELMDRIKEANEAGSMYSVAVLMGKIEALMWVLNSKKHKDI